MAQTEEPRFYFPSLDGLRFIAFLLVFFSHTWDVTSVLPADFPFRTVLGSWQDFGWIGVDLFLVLSSFLIFSLLLAEHEKTGHIGFGGFYVRRSLRIWPLYFFYLLLGATVLVPLLKPQVLPVVWEQHGLPLVTFLGNYSYANFLPSLPFFLAHLWTISLEEQFYLLAPVVGLFLASRKARIRDLLAFATVLLLFAVAWRVYFFVNEFRHPWAFVSLPSRLDPFVVGALLAVAYARWPSAFAQFTGALSLAAAAAGFILIAAFEPIGQSVHTIWQLAATAAFGGFMIVAAMSFAPFRTALTFAPVRFLGRISYGLYVYHVACILVISRFFSAQRTFGPSVLSWSLDVGAALAVNIAIATLSYFALEHPFLRLKRRFERVQSRPIEDPAFRMLIERASS